MAQDTNQSAADAATLIEIERVRAAGLTTLFLDGDRFRTLNRIPLEVDEIDDLKTLNLNHTQTSDLTPLQSLTGLQKLYLSQTHVNDLRPICDLPNLENLWFPNTLAAQSTPELIRISQIVDDPVRTTQTLTYLKTLPPWPAPLPWDIPSNGPPDTPPPRPELDAVPHLILTDDNRVDLAHSLPTPGDLSDPIKERLYRQLPGAVLKLVRFGNRYTEVNDPAETLKSLTSVDFSDADILDIHLQVAALSDVRDADAAKPAAERLDPECLTAVNAVIRLGPPITMGHPDVELFEQRSVEYARTRRVATVATVAEGERRVTAGLAEDDQITTARTRDTSKMLANAGDTGRVADYRASFTRNAVIALGTVAGAIGDAAVGHVADEAVLAAAHFLILHADAIMATAPSWGESGYKWAEYLLIRAQQILRDARKLKPKNQKSGPKTAFGGSRWRG